MIAVKVRFDDRERDAAQLLHQIQKVCVRICHGVGGHLEAGGLAPTGL